MGTERFFEFKSPTRIIFGLNVVERLGAEIKSLESEDVFLVTDKGVANSGVVEMILNVLKADGINYEVFDAIEPNPTVTTVHRAAEIFGDRRNRILVALGGGSVIDTAKALSVKATHDGSIKDYTRHGGKVVKNVTLPLIAIPTTAGTGSEVSWTSLLVDTGMRRKIVIPSVHIMPKVALLDPLVTKKLPPAITASTGMDALTHAIEAYVSLNSQPIADVFALRAIRMVSENLREAVGNGENIEARSNMLLASTMAGMAFANSGLGLVHSIAHALGGRCNLAHGVANSIMLPRVMRYNLIANPGKYRDIAVAMGEDISGLTIMEAARKGVTAVENLSSDIEIPFSLKELGIEESMIDQLAEDAMDDRGTFPVNPRKASKQDLIIMFKDAISK